MNTSFLDATVLSFFSDTNVNARVDASVPSELALFADNATQSGTVSLSNVSGVRFAGSSDGMTCTLTVPSNLLGSYTITLPEGQGGVSQVMENDGTGGLSWTSKNATTYAVQPTDSIIGVSGTTASPVTVTLPLASVVGAIVYTIKDTGGNAFLNPITVVPSGGNTIDGEPDLLITGDRDAVTLLSDGVSAWYIV